jgi:hypothetical protein
MGYVTRMREMNNAYCYGVNLSPLIYWYEIVNHNREPEVWEAY